MSDKVENFPKIQVIMSTYNGEEYIAEQIKSIFNQKDCDIKLLVRDDGSTDSTVSIIENMKKKYPIKVINGKNLKPAKSFLKALRLSDTDVDYYAFSDQDDVWKDEKISRAINKIKHEENNNMILYTGNLCAVDKKLNVLKQQLLPESIDFDYKILISHSSKLFGCTMVFNKNLRNYICNNSSSDAIMHDLWLGILASLKGKIIYDSLPFIYYRQHDDNQVGSQLTFKEKMQNRVSFLKGNNKGNIARQAKEIYEIIKKDDEIPEDIKEYTKMVADYNISIKNKLKYLKEVKKSDLSLKQWVFHVILILQGNL